MAKHLAVPYYPQKGDGYCLAACAQMVLAYQNIVNTQTYLAQIIRVRPSLGTATRHIQRLSSKNITVIYEAGTISDLHNWVIRSVPVIVFVQVGELSYSLGEFFQHAVVVVGFTEEFLWLLDPEMTKDPIQVAVDEFMLAWGEMDYLYAVIKVHM